jgi:YHS domain-containing protein
MAKDPICGMDVDITHAKKQGLHLLKDDKDYYFCSPGCMKTFSEKGAKRYSTIQQAIPIILITFILVMGIVSFIYDFMLQFMGGFFIAVALLKMADWKGFAQAFAMYDIVAKRSKAYAMAYPAIEFGIGALFLLNLYVVPALIVEIVIMGVGSIGVIKNMLSSKRVECACLGTLINIPLTKLTLVEDLLMLVMGCIELARVLNFF